MKTSPARLAEKRRYYQKNKELIKAKALARYHADPSLGRKRRTPQTPASRKNAQLKHKYGLSLADYNLILEAQGGVCAICEGECSRPSFSVDHCHDTGKVRGLLCSKCNTAIGLLSDDYETTARAAHYLKKGGTKWKPAGSKARSSS